MQVINIFKNISREEKLRIYEEILHIIEKDVQKNDSNLCEAKYREKGQSINRNTN